LSQSDADDCTQQVWLLLYNHLDAIREPDRLASWLAKSAFRLARRQAAKSANRTRLKATIETENIQTLPDEAIEQLERQAELEYAIRQLDGKCRQLIEALFFASEDRTYADIAKSLGMPLNSLGPTRTRCLEKLKKILKELGYH
jgi:RNA polymerase sigma factor (sigma-70 family)